MTITPDVSRIIPFTSPESPPPVTIREYTDGNKHLYYINAHHVQGTDNDTCNRINEAISHLSVQHMVIEAAEGASLLENSEAAFAEKLAKQQGIPVVRGEPSDKMIFGHMQEAGYSVKDVMALYLVRIIAQMQQQGRAVEGKEFDVFAENYLAAHPSFSHVAADEKLTYEAFKAQYTSKLGKPITEIRTWDVAPLEDKGAAFFQKLNAGIGRFRDEHLISVTGNILNQPDTQNVLVVYGDSHRAVSEPVWEHALGKGVDVNPAKGMGKQNELPEEKRGKFGKIAMVAGAAIVAGVGMKIYLDQKAKNTQGHGRG